MNFILQAAAIVYLATVLWVLFFIVGRIEQLEKKIDIIQVDMLNEKIQIKAIQENEKTPGNVN
jgi:hypothetical protein